ncbi:MAG: hypothetical protein EOM80_09075 [Erysipelotrichia bacterium]|nr:hypothetical protein [Erysipelotrichia bacterium]
MKKKCFALLFVILCGCFSATVEAANPVIRYFSRLLDETRAEKAIGELMQNHFVSEISETLKIVQDKDLSARMCKLAENAPKTDLVFNVMVVESDIPDEIPLPGGYLILTSGLLSAAVSEEQRDFILARNIMHIILKHPTKLIKLEGLYPGLLNQLKLIPEKRNAQQIRALIRDYLRNLPKMNHKKADLQGILLTTSPDRTRQAAIAMLSSFTAKMWPVLPWDTGDLPARIGELEKLKLPE